VLDRFGVVSPTLLWAIRGVPRARMIWSEMPNTLYFVVPQGISIHCYPGAAVNRQRDFYRAPGGATVKGYVYQQFSRQGNIIVCWDCPVKTRDPWPALLLWRY
jgi:hypothetical protein